MNNPMQDSIDGLNHAKKVFNESIKNSQPVKDGELTAEEAYQEPGYILYDKINETCISILKNEKVIERFARIEDGIGLETTRTLIELLTIIMTHSAYQSICVYDELLKKEITKQFEIFGNNQNILKSITDAHESVLKVFKEKINKLESKETINKFAKENNISE